jgi:hypothetical protein
MPELQDRNVLLAAAWRMSARAIELQSVKAGSHECLGMCHLDMGLLQEFTMKHETLDACIAAISAIEQVVLLLDRCGFRREPNE